MLLGEIDRKPKKQKTRHDASTVELPQEPPVDRLTSLPDAILIDIISLLSTKNAVSTSVLSRRYRHLWTEVTSLHLDCHHFPLLSADIYAVADRLLTKLTSPVIRSFFLSVPNPQPHYLESWLRLLCSRHVQKIELIVVLPRGSDVGSPFTVPHCVFRTQSLVSLSLPPHCFDYYELPDDPNVIINNLPNLRELCLKLHASNCGFVSKLVSSCPLLEKLTLCSDDNYCTKDGEIDDNNGGLIEIYGGNLKTLRLKLVDVPKTTKVVIDTPKLRDFFITATRFTCCFVKNLTGLHNAIIHTYSKTLMKPLIPVMLNVRWLYIGSGTFDRFQGLVLRSLSDLELRFSYGNVIDEVKITSPNLLLFVKSIKIRVYFFKYRKSLIKLAKYLINNAPVLERLTVVIYTNWPGHPEPGSGDKLREMKFCKELYNCSRKFSVCLIAFRGRHVNLPTNSDELQVLEDQIRAEYSV